MYSRGDLIYVITRQQILKFYYWGEYYDDLHWVKDINSINKSLSKEDIGFLQDKLTFSCVREENIFLKKKKPKIN